jgi:hypothetical protein
MASSVPSRAKLRKGTSGMNERQTRFVERYLITGNATQSHIEAGYKERGAAQNAAAATAEAPGSVPPPSTA